jgi:phage tail-like protein
MAQITNPRKAFQFTIGVQGLNPFLAQEVTSPDTEIEQVLHGDTNFDVKTAGRVKYGNLIINKISTAYGVDNFFWPWHYQIMNVFTGGGSPPPVFWKNLTIDEYAIDGQTVIGSFIMYNAWPTKLNGQSWKRMASENTIEQIEFAVERIQRL